MRRQAWIHTLLLLSSAVAVGDDGQKSVWEWQRTGVSASLRGLCVVDSQVIWASGSEGTVIRTEDAGRTWHDVSVPEAVELDFRDIQAFDAKTAVIVSAGQPARFYRTQDGGENLKLSFEQPDRRSFFDAVAFWDRRHGIAMSDPIDGHVLLVETSDGGATWSPLPRSRRPATLEGEAGFAASGTNMIVAPRRDMLIAMGGAREGQQHPSSRVLYSRDGARTWEQATVPLPRNPSSGIFSLALTGQGQGVAVGGNYLQPKMVDGNVAVSGDGGKTWVKPKGKPPRGFRSCVSARTSRQGVLWVAVGPTGTDLSTDGGNHWQAASEEGFHAVQFRQQAGFASGMKGRVARWIGP